MTEPTEKNLGGMKYVLHKYINEEITIFFIDEFDRRYKIIVPANEVEEIKED